MKSPLQFHLLLFLIALFAVLAVRGFKIPGGHASAANREHTTPTNVQQRQAGVRSGSLTPKLSHAN
jgi:hypothetical protein